jgi:iron complex transport system permease protein
MARMITGPDHEKLLPVSAATGAIIFMFIDISARTLSPVEIPLGVITALLGAPVFIYLLIRSRGNWVV